MGTRGNVRDYLILTNNPLVRSCLAGKGRYTIRFEPELGYRELLVLARDLVYAGHILYTHPLAGSVKPNETPYKSLIVSQEAHGMETDDVLLMGKALEVFDKLRVRDQSIYSDQVRRDFQLIDYTLLCGAIGLDAAAGLSNQK